MLRAEAHDELATLIELRCRQGEDPWEVIPDLPSVDDDVDADDTEMLVVRMPVGAARAFAKRTHEIVGAGRPICAVCGYPIDPDGHIHTFPDE